MAAEEHKTIPSQTIEDAALQHALTELSRTINIITTYGNHHPAVQQAATTTIEAMTALFTQRRKVIIGSFSGALTVDGVQVTASGALLKSLERRLSRLRITGLKIDSKISNDELLQLAELLSCKEANDFQAGMGQAGLAHISTEETRFEAVREDQTVANTSDLAGMGGSGVLVLEDDSLEDEAGSSCQGGSSDVHVEQIVAFLKGDIDLDDKGEIGEELAELASDPARLGKMIMESVAVRQSVSELSGESLGDIVLGCLRRTFNGLRKQAAFQSSEGVADMRKALLLLEESVLDRMRDLTGDSNPELDRQIVQTIREMDESLGFEMAAMQYMEHRDAIEHSKEELQAYVKAHGATAAEGLLSESEFPASEWRRIVVDSRKAPGGESNPPIAAGINTLATVFEKLENLMKSDSADGALVKDLLGEASNNLDDTIFTTKEKLDVLSQHLKDDETGTIGGQGRNMNQAELLAALSEVAQELMQPLTAINASLEMMMHGYVGEISEEQRDLLNLASNSGEHLKYLMRELIEIVGCPTNKGVDSRFHTTSEEVILMQQAS
ncbi:hypothetical protein PDESU_04517 [Pontiella desulfatans]|uniref:histidine kinase n=1 Tax=Pontiella desulfatans TaxID=2750659 RepID=A0A6C2U775_PONDE|nr:hypothetical protein [Pontiella desulfatans]VGO15928.1 hypothetical protein PDESU_04517 [Pontiella desulfatans]